MSKSKQKKCVIVKRPRMIHIMDPKFNKHNDKLSGIVLFTNSTLPDKNKEKQYFMNITKILLNTAGTHLPFFSQVLATKAS